jgi:hypothetical protein
MALKKALFDKTWKLPDSAEIADVEIDAAA